MLNDEGHMGRPRLVVAEPKSARKGMMTMTIMRRASCLGSGVAMLLAATAASAQAPYPYPPPSPEAAAIRECLCLKQSMNQAAVTLGAKRRSLDAIRDRLARTDARLDAERRTLNVNDPQAVAQFRQELQRRDAMFQRSNGSLVADVDAAVRAYNSQVNEYNARCANRPMDPILLNQVQATLSCPAQPY